jgi:hypothetical protein
MHSRESAHYTVNPGVEHHKSLDLGLFRREVPLCSNRSILDFIVFDG